MNEFVDLTDPTIVDGGAAVGRAIETFLSLYESPTIHAVEPVPEHLSVLKAKYSSHDDVLIHDVALGEADGGGKMHVNNKTATSSLLRSSTNLRKRRENNHLYHEQEVIPVRKAKLDDLVPSADILKLDLQGYELNALQGGTDLLESCLGVIVEVSFVPYYEGQPLFTDIDQYLNENNFHIYDLYANEWHRSQLGHGDAVYFDLSVFDDYGLATPTVNEQGGAE